MKTIWLCLFLIFCFIPTLIFAQDTTPIWSNGYHKKLGRIDNKGIISDDSNVQDFGKKIGRVKEGVVFDSPHGGLPVGRLEQKDNVYNIYDSAAGGKAVGRWENGKIYDRGSYGGQVIGVTESKDGASYFLLIEGGFLEENFTKRKWNE